MRKNGTFSCFARYIPFIEGKDAPKFTCFNCWMPDHQYKNFPNKQKNLKKSSNYRKYKDLYCKNCGRRGIDYKTCYRCQVNVNDKYIIAGGFIKLPKSSIVNHNKKIDHTNELYKYNNYTDYRYKNKEYSHEDEDNYYQEHIQIKSNHYYEEKKNSITKYEDNERNLNNEKTVLKNYSNFLFQNIDLPKTKLILNNSVNKVINEKEEISKMLDKIKFFKIILNIIKNSNTNIFTIDEKCTVCWRVLTNTL